MTRIDTPVSRRTRDSPLSIQRNKSSDSTSVTLSKGYLTPTLRGAMSR